MDRRSLCAIVVLWCAVWVVYLPTRNFEFLNFDDNEYITENPHVNTGLTVSNITWAFGSEHGAHWHPLSWISHMVDCELFGLDPGPHHLVNVGIHATNSALFFAFLVTVTSALGPSLFAALLFGLHPMRIESVAWVTERKDVLSVFFILLTMLFYQAYSRKGIRCYYGTALGTFIVSLLAKPTGIVLPFLLLCLDHWPLRRTKSGGGDVPFRSLLIEKVPFVCAAFGVALMALWAQTSGGGLKSLSAFPAIDRAASVLVGYQAYFGKFFLPSGIAIFYPFQQYQPGVAAGALLSLVALSWCVWANRVRFPSILSGWLWFLIALLPVIGIVQIGGQAFADRWTYVPHIGLLFGITWALYDLLRDRGILRILVSVAIVATATALTINHLPNWKSSESIFRHSISVSPDNFMAHMNLGVALDAAGKLTEAATHYDMAVTLRPHYPDALNNLGGARARLGDLRNAEYLFQRAVNSNPSFVPSLYNLGLVLTQTGRPSQGLYHWVKAAQINPAYPQLLTSLQSTRIRYSNSGCDPLRTSQGEIIALQSINSLLGQISNFDMKENLARIASCGN